MKQKPFDSILFAVKMLIIVAIWLVVIPILMLGEWLLFKECRWNLVDGCETNNADGTMTVRTKRIAGNHFGCCGHYSAITFWGAKRHIKRRIVEYVLDGSLEHGKPHVVRMSWRKKEHEITIIV